MLKSDMKKIAAAALAGALCLGSTMAPMTAFAANYDPQAGDNGIKLGKYLVMPKSANVPNVTFNYTISGSTTPQQATTTTQQVFAGNDTSKVTGAPTIGSVTFSPETSTYTTVQDIPTTGNNAKFKIADGQKDPVTLASTEKYARGDIPVSFANVTFNEPGIYRYVITETASSSIGITDDTDVRRALDVYVVDDAGALAVSAYVLHNSEADTVPKNVNDYPETKPAGFVNRYTTKDLTLEKTVTGNAGSKDEYFKFTVSLTGMVAGTILTVDLSAAEGTTQTNGINTTQHTNPSQLTVGNDGTVTQDYFLQHGQKIIIKGVPCGASYTVTEATDTNLTLANEGYTTSIAVEGDTVNGDTSGNAVVTGTAVTTGDSFLKEDTKVTYTNNKTEAVPTGLYLSIAPAAAILALAVFGFMKSRSRKVAR